MYKLSNKSLDNLKGVHPDLVTLVNRLMELQIIDFTISEGVRTRQRQEELFKSGKSKTLNSKHLIQSDGYGHAVDIYPYPVDMVKVNKGNAQEISRFGLLAGAIKTLAKLNGISVRWGGDWDSDGQTLDHSFFDAPHFEKD
jgi:peptidoglycan LD-endopeptidase CwlK